MDFESERAHELRRMVVARRQKPMRQEEAQAWSLGWLQAWPWAKRVAMEVQQQVEMFDEPWEEVWTRAEAKAWAKADAAELRAKAAEAEARALKAETWEEGVVNEIVQARTTANIYAKLEASAKAEVEAIALAGIWIWARRGAQLQTEGLPSALPNSSAIRDVLSSLNRYGLARHLWHRSRETRDEYSCLIHFITPITRLPFELLQHIFLIIIGETCGPPLLLMLVCKQWRAIVTSVWASLILGTRTPIDVVTKKLERNQWLLDILMDTDSDRGDFIQSGDAFDAIFAAIEASQRWRRLIIKSFPAQADLPEALVNRGLQRCSNDTMGMSRFTTFKIKSACETSPLLHGLLRILGTMARDLISVQINSANVISFLAPSYPSMFNSVKVLSLDTPGVPNPVDLLPHLHQLERFTASHISFPIYHIDVDLPFVHTLCQLSLRAVSIQWMCGRTFHALEDCTLIFPLHRHVLHTFRTTLPNCKRLIFQGSSLHLLNRISAHELHHLSVTCSGSFNGRGAKQLVWLSRQVLGESRLTPKILHISIEATNQAWVYALALMSNLEELMIHSARPSSLGAKVLQSLVVRPVHARAPGKMSTPGESGAPLCPLLRRFGLKYTRWLRSSEQFDLIPVFASIIQSRQHANCALESFRLWLRSDQNGPLELIEGSEMLKKFACLHRSVRDKLEFPIELLESPFPAPWDSD